MNDTIEKVDVAGRLVNILVIAFVGIGLGLSIWFSVYADRHDWFHKTSRAESQEQRSMEWAGEKTLPKAPLKITIHSSGCVKIDRARIDNDQFSVIFSRICGGPDKYSEFHWRMKANSVVINSWYTNHGFNDMAAGETFEWISPSFLSFSVDPRATEIVLETMDKY